MIKWLTYLFFSTILFSSDDGLAPNFVYLEPIEDFYVRDPISLEIIVTDRNIIEDVMLFYRFNDENEFLTRDMEIGKQNVIYTTEIPIDEVEAGFIQYYFWAKDEYGNESTWPEGGEDLPVVLPIYQIKQDAISDKLLFDNIMGENRFSPPKELQDNLPYYLEVGMLAPDIDVKYEEGVPVVVISIFDSEEIVNSESVKLIIDNKKVDAFISSDMITFIPDGQYDPGYHIIRYEAKNLSDELLVKEFSFFMNEKTLDDSDIDKVTWKEKLNFKGDVGWNTNYDPSPNNPIDIQKFNSSAKFKYKGFKFNYSGLFTTNLFDEEAREDAKYKQPATRIKFNMKSKYIDFYYGDNSPEFSSLTLKGTRVRGTYGKIKLGNWHTSIVIGETKHWVNSNTIEDNIDIWNQMSSYSINERVYDEGRIWYANYDNIDSKPCKEAEESETEDAETQDTGTCVDNPDWTELEESEFSEISNDNCSIVYPEKYGLNPNEDSLGEGKIRYIWNGSSCEEVVLYSDINMFTQKDGVEEGELYEEYDECRNQCIVPIQYIKGSPIRETQGIYTSKDFFNHIKFGLSAVRSLDVKDNSIAPYTTLDNYTYEGNFALGSNFMLHVNNKQTVLTGEYGLTLTMDQTKSDTIILKEINDIDIFTNTKPYFDWYSLDKYCMSDICYNMSDGSTTNIQNVDSILESLLVEGLSEEDLDAIEKSRQQINSFKSILGFDINDDIIGYGDGKGISGLKTNEVEQFISGNMIDRINLLLKRPAYKIVFKTPIPFWFTKFNYKMEINQAPLNYLSHNSSSVQTDVRNLKNSLSFKLLKNQLSFSFGYDNQIKSPWDPESQEEGEIKRTYTDTKSGSIGINIRNFPSLNYSTRLQNRESLDLDYSSSEQVGLKKIYNNTVATNYKISMGKVNINLNGNLNLVRDLDMLADKSGCFEMLTNNVDGYEPLETESCVTDNGANSYYFLSSNNPLNDSGTLTTTYTGATSFTFSIPVALNLGWGLSKNIPNDIRQSETVITVFSAKFGSKLLNKTLNVTIGGNYVISYKGVNGFWDSSLNELWVDCDNNGECIEVTDSSIFSDDWSGDQTWTIGEIFIDKIEVDNTKLALKAGIQYKIPKQKITIGLNFDYSISNDNILKEQVDLFKAKATIKYGF